MLARDVLKILDAGAASFSRLSPARISRVVSYSRNIFIPLTNACRNACAYCGFRSEKPYLMQEEEVLRLLRAGAELRCREALFTFGERPEVYPEIERALAKMGYASVVEYLYHLCERALKLGLLPHSNPGVVGYEELRSLREVNASMGLMLENASERLCGRGMPHEHSPGKRPRERLRMIASAGKLRIPFTTGLLIGIGETSKEIAESLLALKRLSDRYGHIQEVIIQNFKPKKGTPMEHSPEPSLFRILKVVRAAAELFREQGVQVPPNLNQRTYAIFLLHGANDLGGVSPLTKDYINPEDAWPREREMRLLVEEMGLTLRQRLPIYPEYVKKGWYSERVGEVISQTATRDGYARE
ncbi:MAG: 7,8-didemethyl-8-hydroxy-5-deazariboflavin synthase subunit CofG [Euryarchaeota archaeon]|nr:7,8-didemethyl-8-hydroxy-5-deazariboflavin synthase subunit CofG [Euryarchaeota archaeon]